MLSSSDCMKIRSFNHVIKPNKLLTRLHGYRQFYHLLDQLQKNIPD